MTDMERHLPAGRDARIAATPIFMEYAVVLAVIILIGAVALAEASGLLDAFVHEISFLA
jgi:hypothetical protein